MENTLTKKRYYLIDSIRGFALVNMVAFHLLYDLFQIYGLNSGWYFEPLTAVWERFICVTFVLVSGISMNFSHHAYRRGIMLNLFGFAITAVTVFIMPNEAVWFGILNLLGCGMLIIQPLRAYLDHIQPLVGMIASLAVFAVTYGVPSRFIGAFGFKLFDLPDEMYSFKWLSFLGLPSADFASSDFFPLIPWVFMFAVGYFLWRFIKSINADRFFTFKIPVLDTIGRYSLWVYIAHQPVLMGALMLLAQPLGLT